MITTHLYDLGGKISGKVNLPESFFKAKINRKLLAQAVRVYLSNQRKAHAKIKTRGEVDRTKAKAYRQKGTGRARHGARSAPLFVGGGVAHGPEGNQNWKRVLPQKMRKQALASALTSKLQEKQLVVIKGLEKIEGKTKEMKQILQPFLKESKTKKPIKFLLVSSQRSPKLTRACRNLPNFLIRSAGSLNAYEVLNGDKILMTPESIEILEKR